MYQKNYRIKTNVKVPLNIEKSFNFLGEFLLLQVFKDSEGFLLKSNSERISEGFKRDLEAKERSQDSKGFIMKQEEGTRDQKLFLELYENPLYLDKPKEFLDYYQPIIRDLKLEQIETDDDIKIYKAKITPNRVYLSLDNDYHSVPEPFVEVALAQETQDIYKPYGDTLFVSKDKLLILKEGFYSIFPRAFFETSQNKFSETEVLIDSEIFTKIVSNYKFEFDGNVTDVLYVNPGKKKLITCTMNCKNPLRNKDQLLPTKEYILFKAERDRLEPYCLFAPTGDEPLDEIKNLMKSHEEYLRSYFFVSNEIVLSVNSEEVELKTKDFEKVKKDLIERGLPQFNFQF